MLVYEASDQVSQSGELLPLQSNELFTHLLIAALDHSVEVLDTQYRVAASPIPIE